MNPQKSDGPLRSTRYHSLDFWRGIACLMITVYHAAMYGLDNPSFQPSDPLARKVFTLIGWMWLGVPFFFVISGYCITAACDTIRYRPCAASEYFFRRFRRIFPPYWIVLVLSILLVGGVSLAGYPQVFTDDHHPIPSPFSLSWSQWLGNVSLTETWRGMIGDRGLLFLRHAWSLCYEEQFYAICGLALFIAPRRFFHVLLGVTLAVGGVWIATERGHLPAANGLFLDGRWFTFSAGILVYYRVTYARGWKATAADAALLAALTAAILLCRKWPAVYRYYEFPAGLLFAALIAFLHRWDLAIHSSRLLKPITLCGTMCYSLYLVHWPIVKAIASLFYSAGVRDAWPTLLISIPTSVGVSIALSWIFHVLVERRFLNSSVGAATAQLEKEPSGQVLCSSDA